MKIWDYIIYDTVKSVSETIQKEKAENKKILDQNQKLSRIGSRYCQEISNCMSYYVKLIELGHSSLDVITKDKNCLKALISYPLYLVAEEQDGHFSELQDRLFHYMSNIETFSKSELSRAVSTNNDCKKIIVKYAVVEEQFVGRIWNQIINIRIDEVSEEKEVIEKFINSLFSCVILFSLLGNRSDYVEDVCKHKIKILENKVNERLTKFSSLTERVMNIIADNVEIRDLMEELADYDENGEENKNLLISSYEAAAIGFLYNCLLQYDEIEDDVKNCSMGLLLSMIDATLGDEETDTPFDDIYLSNDLDEQINKLTFGLDGGVCYFDVVLMIAVINHQEKYITEILEIFLRIMFDIGRELEEKYDLFELPKKLSKDISDTFARVKHKHWGEEEPEKEEIITDNKIASQNNANNKIVFKKPSIVETQGEINNQIKPQGGCYIATCVYGSYDCPQVWTLRRYRDDSLSKRWYGRMFIKIYYAISPTMVKIFGNKNWFKKIWKRKLDRKIEKLQGKGVKSTPYIDKNKR